MPGTLRPPPGAAARRRELPGSGSAPRRPPIRPVPRGEGHSARLGGGAHWHPHPGAGGTRRLPFSALCPTRRAECRSSGSSQASEAASPRSCPTGVSVASTPRVRGQWTRVPRPRPRVPRVSPVRRRSVAAGGGAAQCAGAEWRRGAGRGGLVRRRRGPGWCSRGWRGLGCVAPAPGCPSQHGGTGLRRAWLESALQSHNPDQLWKF